MRKKPHRKAVIVPRGYRAPVPRDAAPPRRPKLPASPHFVIILIAIIAIGALIMQGRWVKHHRDKFIDPSMSRFLREILSAERLTLQCPHCEGSGVLGEAARSEICPLCFGTGSHHVRIADPNDCICGSCQGMGRVIDPDTGIARTCEHCDGRGLVLGEPVRGFKGKEVRILQVECHDCVGEGYLQDPETDIAELCPLCFGLGYNWVRKTPNYQDVCPACGGMGRIIDPDTGIIRTCERCDGRGLIHENP